MKNISQVEKTANSIPGFLLNDEGKLLYRLAKRCPRGLAIVEIGSWQGCSTVWLGMGAKDGNKKVFAIDPHRGSPELRKAFKGESTLPIFKQNLEKIGLSARVTPIVKTSVMAAKTLVRKSV